MTAPLDLRAGETPSMCPICSKDAPHSHDADIPAYETALRRAFVDLKMTSILLDGWNWSEFLVCAANYGHFKGWLTDVREVGGYEEQYTGYQWELTPLGRERFRA